jgi:hypothetical protein
MNYEEIIITEPPRNFSLRNERCFCHLNGYKVKDADARRMLSGNSSMGDIKVSSIKCKNLLDIDKCTYTNLIKNNDGSFTSNINNDVYGVIKGSKDIIDLFLNNLGKTLVFSVEDNYEKYLNIVVLGQRSNGMAYQEVNNIGNYVSITIADDFTNITEVQFRVLRNTTSYTDTTSVIRNLQLEFGTTPTEYVPYFELASKDYIDGTLPMGNIKVSSIKCKNLFDISKSVVKYQAIGFDISNLEIGKTYTLSSNKPIYGFKISDIEYNHASVQIFEPSSIYQSTFVMSRHESISDEQYLYIRLTVEDGVFVQNMSELDGFEIQIEEGTTATEYVPYFEINKDCGYHVIEMDLGAPVTSIPFGELTFSLNSECVTKLTKFINDVNKSNVKKPVLKLVNTNQVASEEYSMPTEITYINSSTPIKNVQPNYMFFGVTMHLADMLWRSKLEITGEWNEDTYTCSSASITLYEEVKASGGSGDSTPVYLLEHTDGLANATNLAITMGTNLGNKIKDIITNCYNNGCKNFIIKLGFNKSTVTNFYGRTLELCMNITSDNKLILLNKYSICPYDTYYTRYFTSCSGSFTDGVLRATSNTIFEIQFKENTQIVTS